MNDLSYLTDHLPERSAPRQELSYIFTAWNLTRTGKLKKKAVYHVARWLFVSQRYEILCGRDVPDVYFHVPVHNFSWPYIPVCPECRRLAEADWPSLGYLRAAQ